MRVLLLLTISMGCEAGGEFSAAFEKQAQTAEENCQDAVAVESWQQAADSLRIQSPRSSALRRTLRQLAESLTANGRYAEARATLDEAEALPPDGDTLELSLARLELDIDEWRVDEAEQLLGQLQRSESLTRKPASFRNRLIFAEADLDRHRGRFEEAHRALEPLLNASPMLAAKALNKLALALTDEGRKIEAQAAMERALALADGADASSCGNAEWHLTFVHNLALTWSQNDRPGDAAPLYQLVLEDDRVHLGPEHPTTANTMYNLAMTERDLGDEDSARSLLDDALRIEEQAYGSDSTRLIPILNEQGVMAWDHYDDAGAAEKWLRAEEIWEAGDKTSFGVTTEVRLAKLYREHQKFDEAIRHLERGLAYAHLNPPVAEDARAELAELRP